MSYASDIKDIICNTAVNTHQSCCSLSELAAILCFTGSVKKVGDNLSLKAVTENKRLANRVCDLLYAFGIEHFLIGKPTGGSGWYVFKISGDSFDNLADAIGIVMGDKIELCPDDSIFKFKCCRVSFLRGAFLGGGFIISPDKEYHAEFVTKTKKLAEFLLDILAYFNINARLTVRRENYVVYIKESESIASLLGIIGAGKAMMELYNVKIERELRAAVNRQVNCDTANLGKITTAAQRQLWAIDRIKNKMGFDKLPDSLRQTAILRLENPDISLMELGALLNPPIGKSGVNHRLKRLEAMAEELK